MIEPEKKVIPDDESKFWAFFGYKDDFKLYCSIHKEKHEPCPGADDYE